MKNNDFTFEEKIFLQIFGTAMGKTFAPSLANLYLLDFDKRATNGFKIKPLLFFRFLDDVFFIWTGTIEELKEYEIYLNSLIPDIKITLTYSQDKVNFLDTTIYKHTVNNTTTLESRVYFKDTDTHELLHARSFHPPHTFRGILKSQVLRFKRLSSFRQDYDKACKTLFDVLCKRGYNKRLLRKTKHDIWYDYKPSKENKGKAPRRLLPIVIPYSPLSTHITREWKRILTSHDTFRNHKIITAYTKHKNLGQLLTSATHDNKHDKYVKDTHGSIKCTTAQCNTCNYIQISNTFTSSYTKRIYHIKDSLDCSSNNIIYLITCRRCLFQYIGETGRTLRQRFSRHKYNILSKTDTPVAKHFNEPNHSIKDLTIIPIEQLSGTGNNTQNKRNRLKRESYWIKELMTYEPFGLNPPTRT